MVVDCIMWSQLTLHITWSQLFEKCRACKSFLMKTNEIKLENRNQTYVSEDLSMWCVLINVSVEWNKDHLYNHFLLYDILIKCNFLFTCLCKLYNKASKISLAESKTITFGTSNFNHSVLKGKKINSLNVISSNFNHFIVHST